LRDDFPHQRKSIGMETGGRQAKKQIAGLDVPLGKSFSRSTAPTAKPARS